MPADIHPDAINALVHGHHGAPFDILGAHPAGEGQISIRAFRPNARELSVMLDGSEDRIPMNRERNEGFFEVTVAARFPIRYRYEELNYQDKREVFRDPYSFAPILSDYDLHLLGEGRHLYSYDKLGAHLVEIDGINGVSFAVWAPNANRVSVIGNFNGWDARVHPMRKREPLGFWELFIPGLGVGELYRYHIVSNVDDYHVEKTDPYGFYAERRPNNASIVADLEQYTWDDSAWMEARARKKALDLPMSTYEVHLGSWKRNENDDWLSYRQLAHELVSYAQDMGYTHLELMPVAEHPLDASWGYQTTGYFAPTSRFGEPTDFMYFVDHCHQNGIGVILDWVPAHFPKDGHSLSYFDGTHLYEHADPRQAEHPDWGTYIFNYGRDEVRNFLLSNAIYWLKKYHIDGLRVDAVSSMLYLDFSRKEGQWIPNKYGGRENLEAIVFLKDFNETVHTECPGAYTIAEESTAWPMVSRPTYLGGLGFTFKWNMGWMHDTLEYLKTDPVFRRYHHNQITFSLFYAFSENFILSLSHDEVVHLKGSLVEKMAGDWWQKFATLRLLFGYQYTHPGKKLNFMGQEFGQWREWSEVRALDWDLVKWPTHSGVQDWVRDLNYFYAAQPALYEMDYNPEGFQWIEANDADQSVYSYIRYAANKSDFLVIACNFTPVPRYSYRIGVPESGYYQELLNSDSSHYGGGNIGNGGGLHTETVDWHTWSNSLNLTIPPLGMVVLKKQGESAGDTSERHMVVHPPTQVIVRQPASIVNVPQPEPGRQPEAEPKAPKKSGGRRKKAESGDQAKPEKKPTTRKKKSSEAD